MEDHQKKVLTTGSNQSEKDQQEICLECGDQISPDEKGICDWCWEDFKDQMRETEEYLKTKNKEGNQ